MQRTGVLCLPAQANVRLTRASGAGMNPAGVIMRFAISALLLLIASACAHEAVEDAHPVDGSLHHPEGICVLGSRVHLVSTNHDRRYRTGALLTYTVAAIQADGALAPERVRHHADADFPEGFGDVLNLAACIQPTGETPGAVVLLDRVGRDILRLEAAADGSLTCPEGGCVALALGGEDETGVMTGIRDPGPAAVSGQHLLFSSRVDEQATHLNDEGSLARAGEALASRPVIGGAWLLGRHRGVALRLDEGEISERVVHGFDGARWGVAGDTPSSGYALGRFGNLLIAFDDDGEALTSRWHAILRGQRRRMVKAGDELLIFGGEDRVLERRSAHDGSLIGLIRDLSFEEPEGAAVIAPNKLLISNFTGHALTLVDLGTGTSRVLVQSP
jgi:hypothetical protein